jgi:hypothetical protein
MYTLQPAELWERSYALYVAHRSADAELLAEVDERRGQVGSFPMPYLWDEDDFDPVAAVIDDLFRRLGWLR